MRDYMRILAALAVLLVTASCVAPPPSPQPPPGANCPEARADLSAIARTKSKVADPPADDATLPAPPAPVAAGADPPWFPLALPLFPWAPRPGRLTLSNFSIGLADVQAFVVASSGDCGVGPGVAPQDTELPLNATLTIPAPPGLDVCWRSLPPGAPLQPAPDLTSPAPPPPEWNRAFTAYGRFVDAHL
jgi:hypothetical protein